MQMTKYVRQNVCRKQTCSLLAAQRCRARRALRSQRAARKRPLLAAPASAARIALAQSGALSLAAAANKVARTLSPQLQPQPQPPRAIRLRPRGYKARQSYKVRRLNSSSGAAVAARVARKHDRYVRCTTSIAKRPASGLTTDTALISQCFMQLFSPSLAQCQSDA